MLECIECGCCSDELGTGWAAFRCDEPDPDEPHGDGPNVALYCPACAGREFGYRPRLPSLQAPRTFSVTMVRPGVVPSFEIGAYEYFGRGLPLVGETIILRRTEGPEAGAVMQGYVTRINPSSDTPIAVTEVAQAS